MMQCFNWSTSKIRLLKQQAKILAKRRTIQQRNINNLNAARYAIEQENATSEQDIRIQLQEIDDQVKLQERQRFIEGPLTTEERIFLKNTDNTPKG